MYFGWQSVFIKIFAEQISQKFWWLMMLSDCNLGSLPPVPHLHPVDQIWASPRPPAPLPLLVLPPPAPSPSPPSPFQLFKIPKWWHIQQGVNQNDMGHRSKQIEKVCTIIGWTKTNLLERNLNRRPPDWCAGALTTELTSPILAVSPYFVNIFSLLGGGGGGRQSEVTKPYTGL